jgi:hypothetical protein
MTDKKTEDKTKTDGCGSCGDKGVMLTEELYASPKCAGCGKPLGQAKKQ